MADSKIARGYEELPGVPTPTDHHPFDGAFTGFAHRGGRIKHARHRSCEPCHTEAELLRMIKR
jgi:hypothetical protein